MPAIGDGASAGRTRPWWAEVATLVAIGGLLVTLVFNTLAVRQSAQQAELQADEAARAAEQARLARLDAQVGMLTSVSSFLHETDASVAQTHAEDQLCRPELRLSPKARAELLTQIASYDYLAWLFNRGTWTMEAAKSYWGPNMVQAFDVGTGEYDHEYMRRAFPELFKFRVRQGNRLAAEPDCG